MLPACCTRASIRQLAPLPREQQSKDAQRRHAFHFLGAAVNDFVGAAPSAQEGLVLVLVLVLVLGTEWSNQAIVVLHMGFLAPLQAYDFA